MHLGARRRFRQTLVPGLLITLLLGGAGAGCNRAVQAQSTEARYTFALVGVPLHDALGILIDRTQISLVYENTFVAGKTAFCRIREQPAEAVLACLLAGTGLDYYRLSSGTYVLAEEARTQPLYGRLAGRVLDADTGAPLADANVLLADEGTGTATNRAGRFAFAALKPGPHRVIVTHVAYHDRADTVWVSPDAEGHVDLSLSPRTLLTAPVVISGFASRLPSEDLGRDRRTSDELARTPGTGDVVQQMNALVGVRAGDALADVHVQGGASGEHQFLLDGATVFVPLQNGGFIGPFSPFAVQQIAVQKAGFEAAHGSHLSGVIEVEHRVAPAAPREFAVQVDPLSVNGRWSGKTVRPGRLQAAWMVAGRAGLWDLFQPPRLENLFETWSNPDHFLARALGAPEVPIGEPPTSTSPFVVGISDLHAAVHLHRDGLHSVQASFYRGRNVFGNERDNPVQAEIDDEYAWTNTTTQVRYEGVLSSRMLGSLGLWMSSYEFAHPLNRSPFAVLGPAPDSASEDFNDISEIGLRAGWHYAVSARHFLSGDVEAAHSGSEFALTLDPRAAAAVGPAQRDPVRWRVSAFVEDRLAVSHRVTLTVGTRLTYLPAQRQAFAEPRLAVQYDHPQRRWGRWAVRGAAGLYRQFLNQFDVATYSPTALVPSVRFWLPLSSEERPPVAYHVTGAVVYLPAPAWQVSIESFYKHQPRLLVLDYGDPAPAPGALTTPAEGYAYGVAVAARRETDTARLAAQYERAVARRRIPNRFDGAFVDVPWSAPHRLYVSLDVLPHPHWTATVRWQGLAGRSWGFRRAYYDYLEPDPETRLFAPFDLSDPEAHRLPFFSQWDVGLAYARTVAGFGLQARLDLINVLGRRNVRDWTLYYDEERAAYARSERRSTPFLSSFSLRVTR